MPGAPSETPRPPATGHREAVLALLRDAYGIDATLSPLDSGHNENHLVTAADGTRYVLKLADPDTSLQVIDLEHAAAEAVQAGTDLMVPRTVPTRDARPMTSLVGKDGRERAARLTTFVPGRPWGEASIDENTLRSAGETIALLTGALGAVDHPGARRSHRWDLTRAGAHRRDIEWVEDAGRRRLVDEALRRWEPVRPALAALPHGLIHGDLNDENLLVEDHRVRGVLDFGDALHNPLVCDLAIALAYLLLDLEGPLDAGARVVAAYHAVRPLQPRERQVLFPLVCARLAVSLVIAAGHRRLDPDRAGWFVTEAPAIRALHAYLAMDPAEAAARLTARLEPAP